MKDKRLEKVYIGLRNPKDSFDLMISVHERNFTMVSRRLAHIIKHSPTGMEWGYMGSGPADLAYAILTDFIGCDYIVEKLYMKFKDDYVARFPRDRWEIYGYEIDAWLDKELRMK
jgi:hypothetical protein